MTHDDDYDEPEDEMQDYEDLEDRVGQLEAAIVGTPGGFISKTGSVGYGLGTTVEVVISWSANHAVLWAVLDGLLSWLYVIYYVAVHWSNVKLF